MTDDLFVDPDALLAGAEVARRQHAHLQRTSDYISDACSQFGAFSGVLNLFEGQYREAVTAAQDGMRDSRTVADRLEEATLRTRTEYLDTDRAVYDDFAKRFDHVAGLPPYVEPGSGNSVPGGPYSDPVPDPGDVEGPGFEGLPGVPAGVSGPAGRFHESPDGGDLPGIIDPQAALEDEILSRIRDRQVREEYLALREQGVPADDAYVRASQRSPDDIASDHVHATIESRAEGAYDRAYDEAIAAGRSPEEARSAASDAAARSRSDDSRDHRNRTDILDDGRTLLDTYQGVQQVVDNVQDIGEGVEQLDETLEDIGDYDDFEDSTPDRSSQEWAGR
ncbi:hypothetical protein [Nocardioides sp.]|uniref:hypothetical protein n=1 Tax=Nocardioides sp. TaxID=35761 RepID=UPI00321C29AE